MDLTGKRALRETTGEFLDYLDNWREALTPITLDALVIEAGGPDHVGVFAVDVINGFCHEGALASDRVHAIVEPIVRLFRDADALGVSNFVLMHDAHTPGAVEFDVYPPHCVRDTAESRIVPELMALPFADRYHVLPKNCVHSAIGTGLSAWLDAHPEVTHRIVVGDCTDLCTFHMATYLRFTANSVDQRAPVILPIDCVDTYDISLQVARSRNIPAHPADFFHTVFLYNMALNGIRIVRRIDRA